MQGGFDDRVHTHFVHAQFRGNAAEIEAVEIRNRDFEPGRLSARPRTRRGGYETGPFGLQVGRQVGRKIETVPDVLDAVNIIDAYIFMQD